VFLCDKGTGYWDCGQAENGKGEGPRRAALCQNFSKLPRHDDPTVPEIVRSKELSSGGSPRKEEGTMSYWIRFSVLLLSVVLLAAACSRESQQTQPVTTKTEKGTSTAPPAKEVEQRGRTLVRIIHAMPGSSALDMFADEAKAFGNIPYKTVTPYKELSGKLPPTPTVAEVPAPSNQLQVVFRIRPVAQDTTPPLAETSGVLTPGNHYTVIVLPSAEGKEPSLKITSDDLTPAPSEKARVRVIHASSDAGEVDVYAKETDKALFDGVNFKSEVGYKEVQPMTATLEVRPKDKKSPLATASNVKWEAGRTYTIIVMGRVKGRPKLEAVTVEDQLGSGTASIPNAPSAAVSY
jgi:Domain of unknown function (DUF4397)